MASGAYEQGRPAKVLESITKHDTTNFTNGVCRAIYVGGAGNIAVVTENDVATVLVGCLAGTIIPVQAKRVNSTDTTATNMVAFF